MTYKLAFNESALSYGNGLKILGFRLRNCMEEKISTKLSCVVQDTDWSTASKMKLSR